MLPRNLPAAAPISPNALRLLAAALLLLPLAPAAAQNSKENADFKLAVSLYNDRLYDLALEQFRQFTQAYPGAAQAVEARYYLGMCQLKLGRHDEARITFQTFALTYQDHPRAPEAWWNTGEAYAAQGSHRDAALAFERVKVFHPRSRIAPDALVRSAAEFARAGNSDDARRVLRVVLQEYPSSAAAPAARTHLGRILYDEGNPAQAQVELMRVVDGDPSPEARAQALLLLGDICRTTGRPGAARERYEEVVRRYRSTPAYPSAVLNLAKVLAGSGDAKGAIDKFDDLLPSSASGDRTAPDTTLVQEVLKELADAQGAAGRHDDAAQTCERFVRSFPGSADVPRMLLKGAGEASLARDFARSSEICGRLLRLDADEAIRRRAQIQLAVNARQQKQYEEAVAQYTQFLDRAGDDKAAGQITLRVAAIYEKDLRDSPKASAAYESLPRRAPGAPLADDALAGAARSAEADRNHARALDLWGELVRKYPLSPFRPAAEERIRWIRMYEARDKEGGMEKLAALLGDVVTDSARSGLSFRLGEIYYRELKNYSAAAAQFTSTINSGIKDSRFVDALFLRARCWEALAAQEPKMRAQAIEAFTNFAAIYRDDPRRGEAELSLFLLGAQDAPSAETALRALPADAGRRDTALLRVGVLQEEAGNPASAISAYDSLLAQYPASPSADEALGRSILLRRRFLQPDSLLRQCGLYLQRYPDGRYAGRMMQIEASTAMESGRAARAVESLERLYRTAPYLDDGDTLRLALAEARVAAGETDGAIRLLETLLEEERRNSLANLNTEGRLLFALGQAQARAGRPAEAKKLFFGALDIEQTGPRASEAYARLGSIYKSEGHADLSAAYFRLAGTAAPAGTVSAEVAGTLFDTGEYEEAIRQYGLLASGSTGAAERRGYEARIVIARIRSGDLAAADKGIEAFDRKYDDTRPELASFELEKGNYWYRKKDVDRARKSFERVAGKYDDTPSAPPARYWLGKILETEGKPEEALKQYSRVIEDYPQSPIVPRARLSCGNIAYGAERWEEAARHYRQVVDDPRTDNETLALAMNNLIQAYQAAGANDAALALTRRYLEQFPDAPDAVDKQITVGVLLQRLGSYDESIAHLESLLGRAGSDMEAEIRYTIGEAYYGKGDYQQAILTFLKVPYLVTKKGKLDWTANAFYMAGTSYEKLGRPDQALAMYRQIVERPGIDETFKNAARKEIDRVKAAGEKPAKKP